MQRRIFHCGGGGALRATILVATAVGLVAAPAAGGQAGSGSPAPDAQRPAATPLGTTPPAATPPAATPPAATPLAATPPAALTAAPTAAAPMPGTLPRYRSPLDGYRPYRVDEPLLPWREANDAVGGLGGHMGHLERPAHGGGQ